MAYGRRKLKKNKIFATGGYMDYQTIFLVVVLLAFGVMMVYSASAYRASLSGLSSGYFAMRQGIIGLAGIIVMMLVSCLNYQFYKHRLMQRLIATAMIACAGIALVLGVSSHGSQRWIEVAGVQLQPSEIVKLLIILYLPSACVKHPKYLTSYQGIIRLIAPCIVSAGLIAKENLSTAVVCVAIMVVIIFVACPDYKILVMPVIALAIAGVLLITTVGCDRFWRIVWKGIRTEYPEVGFSSRVSQRYDLCNHLRGTWIVWCTLRHCIVRHADRTASLYCKSCQRPIWRIGCNRSYDTYCSADDHQRRCCYQCYPEHGRAASVYQLWWYITCFFDGGNGICVKCIKTDASI